MSSENIFRSNEAPGARERLLETTRLEVDQIVEELTHIRESDDFGKVARRLLDLRKMLKNS